MGFFKSLVGKVFGGKPAPSKGRGRQAVIPRSTQATFTPVADEANFTLVSDEASFESVVDEVRAKAKKTIEEIESRELLTPGEEEFLSGEVVEVVSSNVAWIQYLWKFPDGSQQDQLYIGYHDGSVYEYSDISRTEAFNMLNASSHGKWVWDELRVRKTVYGWQKPYRLVTTEKRLWHQAGADSIARHEAIPKSGEPYEGYTPQSNYQKAKGAMGAEGAGVNLGKKGGSRKVAHFTAARAKTDGSPKPKT